MQLSVEIGSGFLDGRLQNEGLVLHLELHGHRTNDSGMGIRVILVHAELLYPQLYSLLEAFNEDIANLLI